MLNALSAGKPHRRAKALGDLPLGYCTINEIKVPPYLKRDEARIPGPAQLRKVFADGARAPESSTFLFGDAEKTTGNMIPKRPSVIQL